MGIPARLFVFSAPVSTILRLVELLSIERRISLALNSSLPHGLKITVYNFFPWSVRIGSQTFSAVIKPYRVKVCRSCRVVQWLLVVRST